MMNNKIKPNQKHIRHTVYYKTQEEKEMVEKYAQESDMTASKVIYRLLKEAGIIKKIPS